VSGTPKRMRITQMRVQPGRGFSADKVDGEQRAYRLGAAMRCQKTGEQITRTARTPSSGWCRTEESGDKCHALHKVWDASHGLAFRIARSGRLAQELKTTPNKEVGDPVV
jgi:hypothetical protein